MIEIKPDRLILISHSKCIENIIATFFILMVVEKMVESNYSFGKNAVEQVRHENKISRQ